MRQQALIRYFAVLMSVAGMGAAIALPVSAQSSSSPAGTSQPGSSTTPGNSTTPGSSAPGSNTTPGSISPGSGTAPGSLTTPDSTTPGSGITPDSTTQPGNLIQPGNPTQPGSALDLDRTTPGSTTPGSTTPGSPTVPGGSTTPGSITPGSPTVPGGSTTPGSITPGSPTVPGSSTTPGSTVQPGSAAPGDATSGSGVQDTSDRYLSELLQQVSQSGSFRTLAQALQSAGLTDALRSEGGNFTILAPTDEAFASIPQEQLQRLLQPENRTLLREVLAYHVVPGSVTSDQLQTGALRTLGGGVAVRVTPERIVINNASVIQPDIQAQNGVVHVISQVLMPQELRQRIMSLQ